MKFEQCYFAIWEIDIYNGGVALLDVYVCVGSSCHLRGSYNIIKNLQELIEKNGLEDKVELKASFCLGHCTKGVSVKVGDEFIEDITAANVEEKFRDYILNRL